MNVLGVDPGGHGAFAIYNTDTRRISYIADMPIWHQAVGKKKRRRVDAIALAEMFELFDVFGIDLMVMEQVGGRTGQSASAGFVFGYGVGLIYMCALYNRFIIETTPPASWKRIMNVPGKKDADDSAIIARADELFPNDRGLWRGPQGGRLVDRAEAAMIAKFGADRVLPTMAHRQHDAEGVQVNSGWKSDYAFRVANADTGA